MGRRRCQPLLRVRESTTTPGNPRQPPRMRRSRAPTGGRPAGWQRGGDTSSSSTTPNLFARCCDGPSRHGVPQPIAERHSDVTANWVLTGLREGSKRASLSARRWITTSLALRNLFPCRPREPSTQSGPAVYGSGRSYVRLNLQSTVNRAASVCLLGAQRSNSQVKIEAPPGFEPGMEVLLIS